MLPDINLNGHCLIKYTISIPEKVKDLYTSDTLSLQIRHLNTDITLNNCLFGSVKLTKNADLDEHKYSGYSTGFDSRSEFSFPDGSMRKIIIILGLIWAHLCIVIIREKIS